MTSTPISATEGTEAAYREALSLDPEHVAGALHSVLGVLLMLPPIAGAAYAWFVKAGRSSRA